MAQEIYERWMIRWVFQTFHTIPVRRGSRDIHAIRTMMRVWDRAGVVVVFPEGGIDNFRDESGHLGVAYLAVKTGASIIPVLIRWAKNRPASIWGTLFVPGQVTENAADVLFQHPLEQIHLNRFGCRRRRLAVFFGHVIQNLFKLLKVFAERGHEISLVQGGGWMQ